MKFINFNSILINLENVNAIMKIDTLMDNSENNTKYGITILFQDKDSNITCYFDNQNDRDKQFNLFDNIL